MRRRALLTVWGLAPAMAPAMASAKPHALPRPTGRVILTLRGRITRHNHADLAEFDLAMLDALPQGRFQGETPWTHGEAPYDGPLGSALLDAVGAQGKDMVISALNDYSAVVPVSDFRRWPVVLATRVNGQPLTVRERGPVWIFYPMDRFPALRNEVIYNRSVWQVSSIELR